MIISASKIRTLVRIQNGDADSCSFWVDPILEENATVLGPNESVLIPGKDAVNVSGSPSIIQEASVDVVDARTTGSLSGSYIDGVSLRPGDTILVPNRTNPVENGVYVAGTTWTRHPEFDGVQTIVGDLVLVPALGTMKGSSYSFAGSTKNFGADQIIFIQGETKNSSAIDASRIAPRSVTNSKFEIEPSSGGGGASDAASVTFTPTSQIASVSVQSAIEETYTESARSGHVHSDATTSVSGFMSAVDKTKLNGVAVGATANSADADLRDRTTHSGSQAITTISGLQTALDLKVSSSEKGSPSGVASLDSSGKVPASQLPSTSLANTDALTEGTTNLYFTNSRAISATQSAIDSKLPSANYTAADVLTKLLTVDGSGSGLDSDKLRGTTPSTFGLTLIDDADAVTARGTLGLVAIAASGSASDLSSGTVVDARLPARLVGYGAVVTDWNNVNAFGGWYGNNAANAPTNSGDGDWYYGFVITEGGGNWRLQYATQWFNQNTYRRACEDGTWGAWERIRQSEAELDTRYLNASNVNSGTLNDARLSSNVPLKNSSNLFTNHQTIGGSNSLRLSGAGGISEPSSGTSIFKNSPDSNLYVDNYDGDIVYRFNGYQESARTKSDGQWHFYRGIKYGKAIYLGDYVNLNSVIDAGFYDVSNPVNGPYSGVGWCYLEVQAHSNDPTNWVVQRVTMFFSGSYSEVVWQRRKIAGTWNSWYPVSGLFTPAHFGAIGGNTWGQADSNDDSVALQRWLDSGKPLYIDRFYRTGAGLYHDMSAATGYTISGNGGKSGLLLRNNVGLSIVGAVLDNPWGSNTDQYVLKDFNILVAQYGSAIPLQIAANAASGSSMPGIDMRNVHVMGIDTTSGSTEAMIRFINIRNGTLTNVTTVNKYFAYGGIGIDYYLSAGSASVEMTHYGCRSYHSWSGFNVRASDGSTAYDDAQGFHFHGCVSIAVNRGFNIDGGPEGFGELFTFTNCHAYFRELGILGYKAGNVRVTGCDFLGHGSLGTIQGVTLDNVSSIAPVAHLTNNTVRLAAASGGLRIGFNLANGINGTLIGNSVNNATSAYGYVGATMTQANNITY